MVGRGSEGEIGRQIMQFAASAVLLVGLSGCDLAPPDQDPEQNPNPEQSRSAGTDSGSGENTASGPIELASPIEFLLVEDVGEAALRGWGRGRPGGRGVLPSR